MRRISREPLPWRVLGPALFFGLLLLLGIWLHRDYGVSWDEPVDRDNGAVSLKYVVEKLAPQLSRQHPSPTLPALAGYRDNDHGVAFELPLTVLGLLFAHHDTAAYYYLRHLSVFVVFWVGCLALYGLARRYVGSAWALLPVTLLVLSPRFFAEAFFNGKDIVFMAGFTLAIYTLARLVERPTGGRALAHSLATAFAVDVRLLGGLVAVFTVIWLIWAARLPQRRRQYGWVGLLYLSATALFVVVGWPYLWEAPLAHFWAAYQRLSHYPGNIHSLYFGQSIPSRVPWHYPLVWISITTPLPYLLAALVGVGSTLYATYRGRRNAPWPPPESALALIILGWLLVPLLLVIGLRSHLYDGWRHLYFIYPALMLLAGKGGRGLVAWAGRGVGARRYAAYLLLLLGLGETARTVLFMVRQHPYQHVYFSLLTAAVAERGFEADYWGLGFREGLEWILRHDASPQIRVATPYPTPYIANTLLLSLPQRQRLRLVPTPAQAQYFITNYRWHPQPYPPDSVGREVYTRRVAGVRILSIFRLPTAIDSVR